MRKKYADYSNYKDILEKEYKKLDIKNDKYFEAATIIDIKKVAKQWVVKRKNGEEEIIMDAGFKWINLYPKEENFVIVAIFDTNLNIVEFYFDIAKDIKYKPKNPVIKDLFLDVVITHKNEVEFLDENELEEAYKMSEIKQKDYELAKKTADKIVNKFHKEDEFEKLKQIAIDYLNKLITLEIK